MGLPEVPPVPRQHSIWKISTLCGGLLVAASLAGVSWGSPADSDAAAASTATDASGLEEITVTAERYVSTIQDTPISISALTGQELQAQGSRASRISRTEYPGCPCAIAGPGLTEYEARGLASNGGAAPTVGFYLDEIPLSPPAVSQSGKVVIDPDLYDIERVEVLRGPQGTLYGSGSMGGTVKVLTNQPKLGIARRLGAGHCARTPTAVAATTAAIS